MWSFLRNHNYNVTKDMTSNLLLAMIVLCTSIFAFGFETAVLATIQAMNSFERRFGEYNAATDKYVLSPSRLAYLNSFPLITYAFGVIAASQFTERIGRKRLLYVMNSFCIAGILLSLFATNYGMTLGGRLLIYVHVGMEGYLVPMYVAELVPATIRGSMVATYALSHIFAAFIASIITNFTSRMAGHAAWQIPVGLILVFPTFVIAFTWLVPESPRWLIRKGRLDEAVSNISYLRGTKEDYPAEEEVRLIQETIQNSPTQGHWRELFKGTNARRTWVGLLAAASTQITGQTFASNYGVVFLKQLNIMDPFKATVIKRAMILASCFFVIAFVERIGRRRMCLIVGTMCAGSLMFMGGLATIRPKNTDVDNGILAMTFLFPVFYMVGFGSTMQIVKSEIPHTSLRDKSTMLHWSTANLCNFLTTFTLPYLLREPANLGAKVGFVYGSITVVTVVLMYFFMPEMTKRSLEEIDEMMEAKVPAWRSRKWVSTGIGSRLTELDNGNRQAVTGKVTEEVMHVETEMHPPCK